MNSRGKRLLELSRSKQKSPNLLSVATVTAQSLFDAMTVEVHEVVDTENMSEIPSSLLQIDAAQEIVCTTNGVSNTMELENSVVPDPVNEEIVSSVDSSLNIAELVNCHEPDDNSTDGEQDNNDDASYNPTSSSDRDSDFDEEFQHESQEEEQVDEEQAKTRNESQMEQNGRQENEDQSEMQNNEQPEIENRAQSGGELGEQHEGTPSTVNQRKKAKKGFGNPRKWKRQKNKAARMRGESYTSKKKNGDGKYTDTARPHRVMGPPCTSTYCRKSSKRMCQSFTQIEREEMYTTFWQKMNWKQRKVFVASNVDHQGVKQKTTNNDHASRRNISLHYNLKKDDVRVHVCKTMFLSTLGLKEWCAREWSTKAKAGMHPYLVSTPKRAKPINAAKRSSVEEFLKRLPTLPSHYCRATTSKLYLEPNINTKAQLHKIYTDFCTEKGYTAAGRKLLHLKFEEMNLGFYQPKKDQCDLCCGFKVGNVTKEVYDLHQLKKSEAREQKNKDKCDSAARNKVVTTMDLESVLVSPDLKASALYYKTKLICHNFTVYDLASKLVVCYFWDEVNGELNANCFASCVYDFVSNEIEKSEEAMINNPEGNVVLYSDGCTAQNRNVTMSNALLYISVKHKITIVQRYLEKGHTQMECDNVHSMVEKGKKNKEIYSPENYVTIMKSLPLTTPYEVKHVDYTFFKNFDGVQYYNSVRPGNKTGDPVVTNIRALRFNSSGTIDYMLRHTDAWSCLPRRAKNGFTDGDIIPLYHNPLKITNRKFDDLQSLKSVIPAAYHSFYDNLPH